jgi:hypothetical protein
MRRIGGKSGECQRELIVEICRVVQRCLIFPMYIHYQQS